MTKGRLSVNLEYLALRFFCGLVNAVPYALAMWLARQLAVLAFDGLRFQRRRTLARIQGAFPDKSRAACRAIAVRSLQNVLQTGVEMMRAPKFDRAWMDRHVTGGQKYKDVLQKLVDEGRGVVVMVPHSGNWYMAAWAMAKYGLPLFAIAARQRNPKINAWMRRQYGEIEVLDRECRDTLVTIKRYLSDGRAFAILPDLRVPRKDVEVDFLRGKANVSHVGAMFAVKSGAPILVAAMRRANGHHVIDYLATLRPDAAATDPKKEAKRLTGEVMRLLDGEVQRFPGEWFWFNKRWILQPPTVAKRQK